MPKKRGAPRGNKNAFKHGFYTAEFKARERELLASMPLSDLSGEIELIRIALKRSLHVQNESTEPLDFEAQMSALRALTLGVESINSMIRTQFILLSARRGIDEWGAQVKKALDELTAAQESLATEAGEPSDGRLPEIVDGMLATAAGEDAGDGPPEA